jgi:hypothetical protein
MAIQPGTRLGPYDDGCTLEQILQVFSLRENYGDRAPAVETEFSRSARRAATHGMGVGSRPFLKEKGDSG